MDVSVIMINYNTYQLAKDALNCIFAQTSGLNYEVILVDNLSPDGSGELLAKEFGDKIVYVQSGGNLGTSKAFNLALAKSSGKYILWLNTDILIKENFIYTLFKYMEENADCGICGGNVLDFKGNPTHSFRRKLPSVKTVKKDNSLLFGIFNRLFKKSLSQQYNYTNKPMEVGYITGADMMIRKSIFDEVGGFDEDIFMYSEETEFTYRVKTKTNYKVVSVPYAHIYHLEGASFTGGKKRISEFRIKTMTEGDLVYFKKCYGEKQAAKYLKVLKRSLNKRIFLATVLFMKDKRAEFKTKKKIISGYM